MRLSLSLSKSHVVPKLVFSLLVLIPGGSFCREIDMKIHWNDKIPLENPHKGWYHHFPDNHINK